MLANAIASTILVLVQVGIDAPRVDVTMPRAYPATITRVKDADTLVCDVWLGFGMIVADVDVRVAEFDAWETSRARRTLGLSEREWVEEIKKGKAAKAALESLLEKAKTVHVVEDPRLEQTYNRRTLWVYIDGVELGELMKDHERK